MAVNESKRNDPRMWENWNKSGATGTIDQAKLESARALGPLPVMGIGEHFEGPAKGKSTVSLGERVIAEGKGWKSLAPIICVVIDGHNHRLDIPMTLPRRAELISKYFPNQE